MTYTYVYTDHLGSILKLTNSSGTVLNQQSFDAWGRLRNSCIRDAINMLNGPSQVHIRRKGNTGLPGEVRDVKPRTWYFGSDDNQNDLDMNNATAQLGSGGTTSINNHNGNPVKNMVKSFFPGQIRFVNLTPEQLKQFALIPEDFESTFITPTENTQYSKIDGFYMPNSTDEKYWFKIPNSYLTVVRYNDISKTFTFDLFNVFNQPKSGWQPKSLWHIAHPFNPFLKK